MTSKDIENLNKRISFLNEKYSEIQEKLEETIAYANKIAPYDGDGVEELPALEIEIERLEDELENIMFEIEECEEEIEDITRLLNE